ncbi:MAG: cupin domain-containing protein [Anaerolineae bacterium]|nr:cupin domain-containing protein [Anaerolineae bacterium]
MEPTQTLDKVSIAEQAGRLTEPFTMMDLVQIDDLTLSIYLCQGTMPFHRHVDQDELFLVHSGTISLETDWGTAVLRPGELAVVPKGVGHRSSSLLRSYVLLVQPRLMINRRNGYRRLFAIKRSGHMEKLSVPAMGRQVQSFFQPVPLVQLDTFVLNLTVCQGTGPYWQVENQSSLVFCYEGQTVLESPAGRTPLGQGELVVVPVGVAHRVSSPHRAMLLGLERRQPPDLPLPD